MSNATKLNPHAWRVRRRSISGGTENRVRSPFFYLVVEAEQPKSTLQSTLFRFLSRKDHALQDIF
jgi:hypothetical protein